VHAVDEFVVPDAVSVGRHKNHRAEESDFFVRQLHRVYPLSKLEGRVHQKSGVRSILDRVTSHQLSVQTNYRVHGCVKHSNQSHKQRIEKPSFQQREFVALRQQLESRNFSGEFNYAADDIRKALRELLLGLNFGRGIKGTCLERKEAVSLS
jgi:hypothetical protein